MKMFVLLSYLISFHLYSKELDLSKIEVKVSPSLGGDKAEKEFKIALIEKKDVSFYKREANDNILFNGINIEYIQVTEGKVERLVVLEDVEIKEFKVPAPASIFFYYEGGKKTFAIRTDALGKNLTFKGIVFHDSKSVSFSEGGNPFLGFSGVKQVIDGDQYQNGQPIILSSTGKAVKINSIRYMSNQKTFSELNRGGLILYPAESGILNGKVWFEFSVPKDNFLGNYCENCFYVLCLEYDHFYVNQIKFLQDKKDKIQGEVLNKGEFRALVYKNGDSLTPYIDRSPDEEPAIVHCAHPPKEM